MGLHVLAFTIAAHDPVRVADFWGGLLGWERVGPSTLRPDDATGFHLHVERTDEPKVVANHVHPDLTTTSVEDQQQLVDRALALGARHLDVGQGPEAAHTVLADPEGNELCVLPPGRAFLAGCPRLGALAGDGSYAVGRFWAAALDWPLVWDSGEETAIQARPGSPKLTWGGPPLEPRVGRSRVHLDLAPHPGGSRQQEVERLLGLGASYLDIGQGDVDWTVMADPDGRELCVLEPAEPVRASDPAAP